ncbi:hypothetical protein [Thorsellia kenyensis]|uniref:Lipoprotein n=1 Tax=Thorsellia kenyensis TaxID=1549888 RepID=A0ABV6C6S6_9GAMM
MKRQKTHIFFEVSKSIKRLFVAFFAVISLSGCQAVATTTEYQEAGQVDEMVERNGQPVVQPIVQQATPQTNSSLAGGGVLQTCLRELEALKRVHQKRYEAKSGDLNRVLTQAKSYMELRENLNTDTVSMVDSAYQFKISRTCNSVRTELTRTLLERLEAL